MFKAQLTPIFRKTTYIVCVTGLIISSCTQSKEDFILESCVGMYEGSCTVGQLQGKSRIQITEDEVRVQYSVKVPSNAEEVVLGTGSENTAVEIGKLKNIHISTDKNGLYTLSADWINNEKGYGSGTFYLSIGDQKWGYVCCSISGQANWEYDAYKKYDDNSFENILKVFSPDDNVFKNAKSKNGTWNAATTPDVTSNGNNSQATNYLQPNPDSENEDNHELSAYMRTYLDGKATTFFDKIDSSNLNKQANDFAINFYASISAGVYWDRFLQARVPYASYSQKRVSELTGPNRSHYSIKLLNVQSVTKSEGKLTIKTNVKYIIDEVGIFTNIESLEFSSLQGHSLFSGWYDISPTLKEKGETEGLENLTANDLYEMLGSNKK